MLVEAHGPPSNCARRGPHSVERRAAWLVLRKLGGRYPLGHDPTGRGVRVVPLLLKDHQVRRGRDQLRALKRADDGDCGGGGRLGSLVDDALGLRAVLQVVGMREDGSFEGGAIHWGRGSEGLYPPRRGRHYAGLTTRGLRLRIMLGKRGSG